ncbi:hypothetical protein N7513_011404 [Penicillium frequentans]|nr:hypothetical protein N7513_011404 [Penicillium glabrum]
METDIPTVHEFSVAKVKEREDLRKSRQVDEKGMCFAPGTSILTASVTLAIESIEADMEVVTSLQPLQYGRTSDEPTRSPGDKTRLYSFNDEESFFTASQMFVTTTGIRALDPLAARALNPSLDVGRLEVGHFLFKATEDGYQMVQIRRISLEACRFEFLYTLHLREGSRSCHVNGYFAYLN